MNHDKPSLQAVQTSHFIVDNILGTKNRHKKGNQLELHAGTNYFLKNLSLLKVWFLFPANAKWILTWSECFTRVQHISIVANFFVANLWRQSLLHHRIRRKHIYFLSTCLTTRLLCLAVPCWRWDLQVLDGGPRPRGSRDHNQDTKIQELVPRVQKEHRNLQCQWYKNIQKWTGLKKKNYKLYF